MAIWFSKLLKMGFGPKKKQDPSIPYPLATFQRRLLASAIDSMILCFILTPFSESINIVVYGDEFFVALGYAFNHKGLTSFIIKYIILQLAYLVLICVVLVWFWTKKGATPGKMITRSKVVDVNTWEKITKPQAIKRVIFCCIFIGPLSFITIPFSKRNQALHDMLAKTAVVVTKSLNSNLSRQVTNC